MIDAAYPSVHKFIGNYKFEFLTFLSRINRNFTDLSFGIFTKEGLKCVKMQNLEKIDLSL